MAKRWTEEEDALLLKLRAEGMSGREITAHLHDRSYAAVRARLASLAPDNLNRPWTEEEKELVFQLKSKGKTNKYIAKQINRTVGAVASFISRSSFSYYTSANSDLSK